MSAVSAETTLQNKNVVLQLFSPKFIELGKERLDVFENCKY
jgi:hypothetical protein